MHPAHRERELQHFLLLGRGQQAEAIRRLATTGMSDYGIAAATSLSVEMVRAVLGERRQATAA